MKQSFSATKYFDYLFILLLPLGIAMGFVLSEKFIPAVIILIIALCSIFISYFRLHIMLVMIIAAILPFTIETTINEGFRLSLPAEPLIAIGLFAMGIDFVKKPGLLAKLFQYDTLWIIPLILAYALTTLFSQMVDISVKFAIVNIAYIFFFFIWFKFLFMHLPGFARRTMQLFSLSFLVVTAWGLYKYSSYEWNIITVRGIFRPFYNDNTQYGATSSMLASFWTASAFYERKTSRRTLDLIAGFVFSLCIFLSNSRAALLSFLFFAVIFIILILRIRVQYLATFLILALVLMLPLRARVLSFLQENQYLSHSGRTSYIEQIKSSSNIQTDISNRERINRWIAGIRMFRNKPLAGYGPGTYQFVYIPFQDERYKNPLTVYDPWHIPENSGGTAHSEYILSLSEMGIFGLLALLIFLGRVFYISFVKAMNFKNRLMIIAACCAVSTYVFHAFFNNFLNTDKFAFLFWGMSAIVFSNFRFTVTDDK